MAADASVVAAPLRTNAGRTTDSAAAAESEKHNSRFLGTLHTRTVQIAQCDMSSRSFSHIAAQEGSYACIKVPGGVMNV